MVVALVKNGMVENVIVAEQAFVDSISSQWQACVAIDGFEVMPQIGWLYDGQQFTNPVPPPPPVMGEILPE